MILSLEEASLVVYDDHEDFITLYDTKEIISRRRWYTQYTKVVKYNPSGKHYRIHYNVGNTEIQDCGAQEMFDYQEQVKLHEVELKEVVVKQWIRV